MSAEKAILLKRLKTLPAPDHRVITFVAAERTQLLSARSSPVQASSALTLWRTRLQIMSSQGLLSEEITSLVDSLAQLPADRVLDQFALVGEHRAGSLFFDATTGVFLGSSIVMMSDRAVAYFGGVSAEVSGAVSIHAVR